MKTLTVFGLVILLFTATSGALAEGKGHGNKYGNKHGNKHGKQHYQQKSYKHGYHHGRYRFNYYKPYRGRRYFGGYYGPKYWGHNYYYPDYVGAALIGSALTYSLYHTHNGAYCYENHGNQRYQQSSDSYREVVGCHRMERLPDGSERRVEVPLSQCN